MYTYYPCTLYTWKTEYSKGLTLTGVAGLEPATNCLEGSYSIRLSYTPQYFTLHEYLLNHYSVVEMA